MPDVLHCRRNPAALTMEVTISVFKDPTSLHICRVLIKDSIAIYISAIHNAHMSERIYFMRRAQRNY